MKKIVSFILCLTLLTTLSVSVFAAENVYIVDELGRLEADQLTALNEEAKALDEKYGVAFFLAYVQGHADDTKPEEIVGDETDYALVLMGEKGTRTHFAGKGAEVFSEEDDRNRLCYVHDEMEEWNDGIARYLEVAGEYMVKAQPKEEPETVTDAKPAELEKPVVTTTEAPEEDSFPLVYLIPVAAAVLIAVGGIVIASKKKA